MSDKAAVPDRIRIAVQRGIRCSGSEFCEHKALEDCIIDALFKMDMLQSQQIAARSSEAAPATPYDAEQIMDDAFAERLADDRRVVAHLEAIPVGKCACPVHEWLAARSKNDGGKQAGRASEKGSEK